MTKRLLLFFLVSLTVCGWGVWSLRATEPVAILRGFTQVDSFYIQTHQLHYNDNIEDELIAAEDLPHLAWMIAQVWDRFDSLHAITYNMLLDVGLVFEGGVVTGVRPPSLAPQFEIWPNPVRGGTVFVKGDGLFELYNAAGKLVLRKRILDVTRVNVSELRSGVYFAHGAKVIIIR